MDRQAFVGDLRGGVLGGTHWPHPLPHLRCHRPSADRGQSRRGCRDARPPASMITVRAPVPHGTLITGRQLGCGRRRLQRLSEQNALRAWPSPISQLRQQMPEVGPEPDHEIERDQRKHARLEYAVSSIVWTARGGVQQPALPPFPRWRERANDLQGHSPATQHRR
jgi:hypothetical protein